MKRIIDIKLGSKSIRSVSDKIVGVRAEEEAREAETQLIDLAALPGQTVGSIRHTTARVTVYAKIRELYDMPSKMEVVNAINKWAARGGSLRTSYRKDGDEELTLNVKLAKPASVGDIRDWSQEVALEFISDGWPYWQRQTYISAQRLNSGQGGRTMRRGNAPALYDVTIQANAPITSLSASVAGAAVKLEGLSIPSGATIEITHNASGVMAITSGGESLFPHLTDDSADCLISDSDITSTAFTASASATATFKTKGGWY